MRLRNKKGSAVVEAALMMPWLAFLFVGVLDFGFYSYAAICTQNAARAAAMLTSHDTKSQTAALACQAALGELQILPNMSGVSTCTALPTIVAIKKLCASGSADPTCNGSPCADCDQDRFAQSVQVSVTYQTIPLVPIPGLTGQVTLTRIAEMRIIQQ
jgi:Flp pilus assembly protein TadG